MQSHFNLEVVIVSIVAFFILLFTNLGYASGLDNEFHRTVYESEALYSSPNFSKASSSRYYGYKYNRQYNNKSNRNYYRGNRYYRGSNSHYRSHRNYNRSNRHYYPSYRSGYRSGHRLGRHYYGHRYKHHYGH